MIREHLQLPRQVLLLCLGALVNRAGSFVLMFLTIYVTESLDYSVQFATRCMGVFGLGAMIASPVGGQLADQFGRKFTMLLSLFGGSLILATLTLAKSQTSFLIGFGLFALVTEMYRPAASAMIADLTPPDKRSTAFGLFYIAINLGFACAMPLGGLLAEYSYSLLFWGDAVTTSLYGVIIALLISETLPSAAQAAAPLGEGDVALSCVARRLAGSAPTSSSPDASPSIKVAVRRILGDGVFLLFCLATLLSTLVFVQSLTTLPIAIRAGGCTNAQFGRLMAINGLMIVALQLPATRFLSRFDPMRVIACGTLLIAVGFGLTSLAQSLTFFALTIAIWTSGEIMQAPFINAVVTHLAPAELRARYLGVFGLSFAVATMIGAPAGGEIMARFGVGFLWTVCFHVALAAALIYVLLARQVARRRSESCGVS